MDFASDLEISAVSKYDKIVDDLVATGLSVFDGFVSPLQQLSLSDEAVTMYQRGEFRHARVGRGEHKQLRPDIRNDHIHWLDTSAPTAIQAAYLGELEMLRLTINQRLFLGLFEFEGHYALYPPGSFYGVHYDRFIGAMDRVVTCILYLNQDWQAESGGALKVYAGEDHASAHFPVEILPQSGRLVTFISELFPHEVLPAQRNRLSLTGWFRIRASLN
ncbi:MAG: 2OG-Fe(II) oxygenase [Zetaproteobacteria bacterium CG_4_9_14_3_um_filter_49_83]|nr:MAG: 2OG-Fe(II) oxygenase [Zetaproteobacteria bacterium CG1_02_49_23]PIQ34856.1 MAG: 2OG-Fe(II) oxygenase [Zetaproteobacteria bacterium CG17_big_fil_post_rev_8_21_14_2_50_50_13]PIY55820.1 MAG: 2OG-Fe(II) oxygenase [Zetaproteobacteria bacterium CG_4_10_14_0_8_um_filter_49_80]PJA36202.1 MAG: 2OG-Fe(II) oxygenase [Zetaproteobacteria bacterium CG_4_9_14_3_um_filter_49_83]